MGSVQTAEPCPKCNYAYAYYELYYKIGDEYIHCPRCGYYLACTRTEEGYKPGCEEEPFKREELGGIGAFRVMFNGGGTIGSFVQGEYEKEQFVEEMKRMYESGELVNGMGEKPDEISYTYLEDGIWMVHEIISDERKKFCDCCGENEEQVCSCEAVEEDVSEV